MTDWALHWLVSFIIVIDSVQTYSELGGSIDISALACPNSLIATVAPPVFALFRPGLPDPLLPVV